MKRLAFILPALLLSGVVLAQEAAPDVYGTVSTDGIAYTVGGSGSVLAPALGVSNRGLTAGILFWAKDTSPYGYLQYAEATSTGGINRFLMSRLDSFLCMSPDWFWHGSVAMTGYGYFNGRPSNFSLIAYDALYGAPDMFWMKIYHLNGALLYERVVAIRDGDIRVLCAFDE
jgi:hypothetical protein